MKILLTLGPKQPSSQRILCVVPQEVASHKSNPSPVPQGIVDLYSTLPWVTWEAVTVVEGIP
jgi:hypothetical protein